MRIRQSHRDKARSCWIELPVVAVAGLAFGLWFTGPANANPVVDKRVTAALKCAALSNVEISKVQAKIDHATQKPNLMHISGAYTLFYRRKNNPGVFSIKRGTFQGWIQKRGHALHSIDYRGFFPGKVSARCLAAANKLT